MTTTNSERACALKAQPVAGIYVHIPFCARKCLYCDFLSFDKWNSSMQAEYARALLSEIRSGGNGVCARALSGSSSQRRPAADTVFIGGGTPSLFPQEYIEEILETLRETFEIAEDAEITIEANPGTLTKEKLSAYRRFGINRLSMGVQSFDDRLLARLGRVHSAAEAMETYKLARRCGFENINLDLMFALPGQTEEMWRRTLETAAELSPEHISFYSLQLEENTPFFEMFCRGEIEQIPDDIDRGMYHRAIAFLKASGYGHYEISNAAKPGYECRHNLKYWSMEDYFGFGLGASGFVGGVRYSNLRDFGEYCRAAVAGGDRNTDRWIQNSDVEIFDCDSRKVRHCSETVKDTDSAKLVCRNVPAVDKGTAAELHENTAYDNESEYIFTGLRKTAGIDLCDFSARFGRELEQDAAVQRYIASGHMELLKRPADGHVFLRFTENGIDISNGILADII